MTYSWDKDCATNTAPDLHIDAFKFNTFRKRVGGGPGGPLGLPRTRKKVGILA